MKFINRNCDCEDFPACGHTDDYDETPSDSYFNQTDEETAMTGKEKTQKDGMTDCFESKEKRDIWFDSLIWHAKHWGEIPSDLEVCKGESPYGDEIPYPHCVNMRWEMEPNQEFSINSKISKDWDDWLVKLHKEGKMGYSEDGGYVGPERVAEFDDSFMFIKCEKIKKLKEVE